MPDVDVNEAAETVRTSDGRVPGRRGLETRDSLLASTGGLLASTSYRDLKVVDIARDAGTSPATFYQYFGDVEEAILQLAERVVEDVDVLCVPVDELDWSQDQRQASALALATAFLEFWDLHEPIMKVVNLAIVEGDKRFRRLRNDMLGPVTGALADRITTVRKAAGIKVTARAARSDAAVLVSMLVHVAEHHPRLGDWGLPVADLSGSMSKIVAASFEG